MSIDTISQTECLCPQTGPSRSYVVQSRRDAANVARLRHLMTHCEDPFGRPAVPGHVTATAFVIDPSFHWTLLLHHRKLSLWLPPGGHCDGDADLLRVALREAAEETGLASLKPIRSEIFDIDIHTIPARTDEPAHDHYDVRFLIEANRAEPLLNSSESNALEWVELSRLESLTDMPSILILKQKLRTL